MSANLKILACDDSLTIRRLVTMVLGREPVDLELAETGEKGIERAKARHPDLILLDFMLPDLTGKDVADALADDFATSGVPIVIMSAKGATVADQFSGNPAVVGYLAKPFKPDALLDILSEHTEFVARDHASQATGQTTEAPDGADAKGPPEKKERRRNVAARILYRALKSQLDRVPGYMAELDGDDVGAQLARRILRSNVVESITKGFGELAANGVTPAARSEGSVTGLLELVDGLILRRGKKFSQRVASLPLTAHERRVASMVDGRNTLGEIYRRTGFDQGAFSQALASLSSNGLVRMSRRVNLREQYPKLRSHWLGIVDPEPAPLMSALAKHLGSRSRPIEVRDLTSASSLVDGLSEDPPLALFLSAWEDGPSIEETLSSILSKDDLVDLPIAVMIAQDDADKRESYLKAGAHRVWTKPFHVDEVWHLILS